MAKTITFGISKGGCSKTTSAGVTAWLLAQPGFLTENGYKVLCVDMDSQGNLTSFLTQEDDLNGVFENKTVFEGIKEGNVGPYVHKINDNLSVVPSNDYLSLLPRYLYTEYKGKNKTTFVLKEALKKVEDEYDFIIIDTPPSLNELTINAVTAADKVVVMFDGSKFCYFAIEKYLEICLAAIENGNENLEVAGILCSIVDLKTVDSKAMIKLLDEEYKGYRFETIIQRKAATKRLAVYGFEDNPELSKAVENYKDFVKELISK